MPRVVTPCVRGCSCPKPGMLPSAALRSSYRRQRLVGGGAGSSLRMRDDCETSRRTQPTMVASKSC